MADSSFDVTVSIVSSGDVALLRACLDSLPAAAGDSSVQTIVVDNAVGIAVRLAGSHPTVDVIAGGLRRGFGANHNLVCARARGRYVFILNDDTVLDPGCIDRLRRFLDQNAIVAAAGPRLRHGDGRVQPSAFHFPTPARVALTTATLQRAGWVMSGGERIRRVDWIHGAAMMVRRDALEQAGGLDEGFYMYLEDVDLCRRLRDRGWEIAFFPPAGLVHHENSSTAAVPSRRIYQHARSRGIYARKHHGRAGERTVQALTAATYLARSALARVLPGYDHDDAARFRAHAHAALSPVCRARHRGGGRRPQPRGGGVSGRVLVTGGLGFIGSAFVRALAADGTEVLNVDLDTYAGDERRLAEVAPGLVETVRVDVASPELGDLVRRERPALIVHFAAETHVTRSEGAAEAFFHANVEGTRSVLDAAVAAGVPRVVHMSTDEVYGPCPGAPFRRAPEAPGRGPGDERLRPLEGARRRSGPLLLRPPRRGDRPADQLHRAVAAPREGRAALGDPCAARRAAAGVGRRPAGARLDVRLRRRLRAARAGRAGRAGRRLQRRPGRRGRCRTSRSRGWWPGPPAAATTPST